MHLEIFPDSLEDTLMRNFMKIRPFEAEMFHVDRQIDGWTDGRTDRHTDMMKIIVVFPLLRKHPKRPISMHHVSDTSSVCLPDPLIFSLSGRIASFILPVGEILSTRRNSILVMAVSVFMITY
jgi:hypothetical protein